MRVSVETSLVTAPLVTVDTCLDTGPLDTAIRCYIACYSPIRYSVTSLRPRSVLRTSPIRFALKLDGRFPP